MKCIALLCSFIFILNCKAPQKTVSVEVVPTETDKEIVGEHPISNDKKEVRKVAADCYDANKKNAGKVCDNTIDYVCGCDGITYKNTCEAEKAGLNKMKKGRCFKSAPK